MQKYSIGSKVVHSPEGVCVVDDICRIRFGEEERTAYKLHSAVDPEKVLYIPVDSTKMKLRLPKTRQEIINLLMIEPEDKGFLAQNCQKKERMQNEAIYADDTNSVMKLLKLYANKGKNANLSLTEWIWIRKAERYLYSEIAEVLGWQYTELITENSVQRYGLAV